MAGTAAAEEMSGTKGMPDYIYRFNRRQRVEHILLLVTFVALSLTGLAQKFYTAGWAEWLILNLGGISSTRLIHRLFALVFTVGIMYHFVFILYSMLGRHERPSMLLTLKDFRDVLGFFRYSFGTAVKAPQAGRYDYHQKFEYWGIIFGSIIIIVSGFILAFPITVTEWLPGQFVPAAKEFHGNEAMLAVLTIVIWHLYDVIFRPEIFPADTTIFTGKISRKRMEEEHPLEYAELVVRHPEEETSASGEPAAADAGSD